MHFYVGLKWHINQTFVNVVRVFNKGVKAHKKIRLG